MKVLRYAKTVLVLVIFGITVHASAPPDIVSGTWHWETDGGDRQITMTFKADGGKLTGTVDMGQVKVKIEHRGTKVEKGSVRFKIDKGKVEGNHFTFLLDTPIQQQTNAPTTFIGDVNGDVIHAVETVDLYGIEIHRIAFTMSRVPQP